LIYIKVQTDIGTDLFWFGCDVRAALSPQKTPASTIVEIFLFSRYPVPIFGEERAQPFLVC